MSPYVAAGIRRDRLAVKRFRGIEFYKRIAAKAFDVPVETLVLKTRKREIVMARQVAMYLIQKNEKLSLKSIGEAFGGRDHTTVIHSKDTVSDLMYSDENYRRKVISLEDRIRDMDSIAFFEEKN
jgi:chromosomal replication initiator protein